MLQSPNRTGTGPRLSCHPDPETLLGGIRERQDQAAWDLSCRETGL